MKAAELKQSDLDYRNHLQAFLNFAVKAKKRTGKGKEKPVYTKFEKFYNREKELDRILNPNKKDNRYKGIGKLLKGSDD